jgi:hypothetical protein
MLLGQINKWCEDGKIKMRAVMDKNHGLPAPYVMEGQTLSPGNMSPGLSPGLKGKPALTSNNSKQAQLVQLHMVIGQVETWPCLVGLLHGINLVFLQCH